MVNNFNPIQNATLWLYLCFLINLNAAHKCYSPHMNFMNISLFVASSFCSVKCWMLNGNAKNLLSAQYSNDARFALLSFYISAFCTFFFITTGRLHFISNCFYLLSRLYSFQFNAIYVWLRICNYLWFYFNFVSQFILLCWTLGWDQLFLYWFCIAGPALL